MTGVKASIPPLNWLRAFEATARHLSFTHAAGELNLSQVAVSKQVKQLELHLREPLFIRHARSLELTRAGSAYLPKVRDAFLQLADGTREVFGAGRDRVITVRCAIAFSTNWLAPRMARFHARHPHVQLRILSNVWSEQERDANALYDLDIRYGTDPWPGLQAERLTTDRLMPLCHPAMAETALREPADLLEQRLIHVLGYEDGWDRWLRAAGVGGASTGLQVDNSVLAFALVEQNAGVALARSSMANHLVRGGRLVQPFDLTIPSKEAFYITWPTGTDPVGDAALFRDWLVQESAFH
ncbi:MAG: LysR substrate-binding domain-containing protein [Pseudomonadota bacterium]